MPKNLTNRGALFVLPLVGEPVQGADWQGWQPVDLLDHPEPMLPQGDYAESNSPLFLRNLNPAPREAERPVELLAPAGGLDAAFAAFHFGADAIYLGLKKFSARAEAENFTLEEVDEVVAYAHSLSPRRRVFVTINTLIRQDELAELIEAVARLDEIGVDALIIQDLGVYHLVRRHFPKLELHASTQLAVHNRAGAIALRRLGFERVVLARELTFEEVGDITAEAGIETEVFIHGALCYSYSGLCLFSSQTLGRSGNRGKCAYSCRDAFDVTGAPMELRDGQPVRRDPRNGFPFSMKDLALPDHLPALRSAGVSCFKIEGRKKSPLYVATTTDYYRKLLDGRLAAGERPVAEADLQTVFSRPWTHLFVDSHKDKEVADRDTVGHRGTLIGHVDAVVTGREPRLRFRTQRPLERHDGVQVDLPALGKPYGFAVDHLWLGRNGNGREVYEADAGSVVEVGLPKDHPPLPQGSPVYCSSSQAVKQRFRHERPKPGFHRVRAPIHIDVCLQPNGLSATARVVGLETIQATCVFAGLFESCRDASKMDRTAKDAFAKLGDTRFTLDTFAFANPDGLFVPVSKLNELRRELIAELDNIDRRDASQRIEGLTAELAPALPKEPSAKSGFHWSIKTDRLEHLQDFAAEDWNDVDEVIIDIARDHPASLLEGVEALGARIGRDRIRFALPALTRFWEEKGLLHKIERLRASGWRKWEAANLSAWSYLDLDPSGAAGSEEVDIATDWSVYVINRLAARQLLEMGVTRFALSPEDGLGNMRPLLAEFGDHATLIVYQDTPLFLAESCAYANLIGGCPGKANCKFESMEMTSSEGERVTALDYHCRTIVLNQGPFCLSTRLKELARAGAVHLRADFIYRAYSPDEVVRRWRLIRAGRSIPHSHSANFDREIQ